MSQIQRVRGRPACGHESTECCVLTPQHVENDQTSTVRLVTVDQKGEQEIDFRVPRLSHPVVKEAEHLRVQELVQWIENHPHREALHADLQQNNVYSPFSKNSKEMIRELGNVDLFELCDNTPIVQCSRCLSLLETRNCTLHLRTLPDFERIQNKVYQTTRNALPMVFDTAEAEVTKKVPHGLECVEEMLQESQLPTWTFYKYSRSISQRSSLSWITTPQSDGQNKSAQSGDELAKQDHTSEWGGFHARE